jgi:molybdate transport system substrate-binding protein
MHSITDTVSLTPRIIRWLGLCVLMVFSLGGKAADVTVFAAASLQNALDEGKAVYEASHGDKIVISYAASSALAKQIESGAPADIFISADLQWMDYVAKRKLIQADTRRNLLSNRLIMIAPSSSTASVTLRPDTDLAGLLKDQYLAVGDPDHVPAGKYAKAALEWMGVWDSVVTRLARADNVRSALAFVALRECPLGIVYESDAKAEPKVRVVGVFPEEAHPPIVYPIVMTKVAQEASRGFYDFLVSPAARDIFVKHGFIAQAQ